MKHKLEKLRDDSQSLCREISTELHTEAAEIRKVGQLYGSLEEFDKDFYSGAPLSL